MAICGSRTTTSSGDYRAYFPGELPKPDFRRLGRDRQIYSIHAPGLPALVAPAFAIAGYRGVQVFLILLAAAGSALAWHLAWVVTRRADAAWFGWAAVTFSTSSIFHSFMVYPDGPGGVIALTGVWALLRAQQEAESGAERTGPWWLHGAALAVLPWLHTRFALVAGCLGALVLLRLARYAQRRGKGGRVPERAGGERDRLDRVLHRDLRDARPSGAVRERGGIDGVHPGRPRRVALRPAVRPARLRAGARLRVCRAGRDGQESRDAPRRPRAAVRPRPVSSRRHAFRDVVGRPKRPGAVLRADALHAGDPVGSRVGGDAPPRHASHGARRAARDGVRLVRAGVRRRRPAGLQRSRRLRRLAGMARTAQPISRGGCRPGGAAAKGRCSATSRSGCARSPRHGASCVPRKGRDGCGRAARSAPRRRASTPVRPCARSRSSGRCRASAP